MSTGFGSYHIFHVITKMHFRRGKYNVSIMKLPKKDVWLKKWNNEMINRMDSLMFYKLDQKYTKDELIRMFSYYWINDNSFYISDIFNDDFKLFKRNEWQLKNIKEVLEDDFLKILIFSIKNNISLNRIFKGDDTYSILLRLFDKKKISINSLIGFNIGFNFFEKIDYYRLNLVQKDKYKKYEIIFDKYTKIVYKGFDFDIKQYLKKCYLTNK